MHIEARHVRTRANPWFMPGIVLWLGWLVGQIARDANPVTAFLFYIPSPLVAAVLWAGARAAMTSDERNRSGLLVLLSLLPLCSVLFVENHIFRRTPPIKPDAIPALTSRPFKVVHWNMARGRLGRDLAFKRLRREEADCYVLSEAPADMRKGDIGPGYDFTRIGVVTVAARGDLLDARCITGDEPLRAYFMLWQKDRDRPDRTVRLLVVDMPSSLLTPRAPALRRLRRLFVQYRADLIIGDFNAPRRSRALARLPSGYVHAYDAVGAGWSCSWPLPVPVFAIDHCIVGRRLEPLRYDLDSSLFSDHRLQVFHARFLPTGTDK